MQKLPGRFMLISVLVGVLLVLRGAAQPTAPLDVARYASDGRLEFPSDTDRWVHLGTVLGGEYRDAPFDPANPGIFGVVQIEPSAYDYFLEHGGYADGTMLLLSFYAAAAASEPPLQGFTQRDAVSREIHVIDKVRFRAEGRAFFVFPADAAAPAAPVPLGSECVQCHTEHGAHDATFTQFYPTIRHLVGGVD